MAKKTQIAEKSAPPTMQGKPVAKSQPAAPQGAGPMQLTPIIQPIAFVPYSTQEQPLYMYDDVQEQYDYDDDTEEVVVEEVVVSRKKKVSGACIALIVFSLIYIALYVISYFVKDFAYIAAVNDTSALALLLNVFKAETIVFDSVTIIAIAIAVGAVCCLLVLIASIIKIKGAGVPAFAKIFAFLGLVVTLVSVLLALLQKDTIETNYGLYAYAVIALLIVIISFLSKNKKQAA